MAGGGGGGGGGEFSPAVVSRVAAAVDAVVVTVAGGATASDRLDLIGRVLDLLRSAAAVSPPAIRATPARRAPDDGTLANGVAPGPLVPAADAAPMTMLRRGFPSPPPRPAPPAPHSVASAAALAGARSCPPPPVADDLPPSSPPPPAPPGDDGWQVADGRGGMRRSPPAAVAPPPLTPAGGAAGVSADVLPGGAAAAAAGPPPFLAAPRGSPAAWRGDARGAAHSAARVSRASSAAETLLADAARCRAGGVDLVTLFDRDVSNVLLRWYGGRASKGVRRRTVSAAAAVVAVWPLQRCCVQSAPS